MRAAYVALAREVGVDGAEIRRRNYIPTDKFPYESSGGLTYDSGDYEPTLDRALELIAHDEVRAEQQRRRDAGDTKHLGIGIATYVEMCGLAPSRVLASLNYAAGGWEAASVRVMPTGKVQVVSGGSHWGGGMFIKGWDEGVQSMQEGGQRTTALDHRNRRAPVLGKLP